jgi:predicted amidophosphoribosyltransferase
MGDGVLKTWKMVHFYCPLCWKEFDEDLPQCPHCSRDIHGFWKSKSYLEKLIVALGHPEPSTVMRAVWLLHQLGDRRAVEPLKRLMDKTQDIYVRRAARRTLDELEKTNTIGENDDEKD